MATKKKTSKSSNLRITSTSSFSSSPGKLAPPKFTATMPKPEAGHVSILSTDPPVAMKLRLGATTAQVQGGVGGWSQVERPRRKAATEWSGLPLETLTVHVLLDGYIGSVQVETEVALLKSLATPGGHTFGVTAPDTEPPVLRLGGMVPHGNKQWVLNDIAWDEEDVVWAGLHRVRQFAVLTFLEYSDGSPLKVKRPTAAKKSGEKTRTITAKKGDTVEKIVKRELKPKTGAAFKKAVAKVKKLNKIRDAKFVLKQGRKIKLPAKGEK